MMDVPPWALFPLLPSPAPPCCDPLLNETGDGGDERIGLRGGEQVLWQFPRHRRGEYLPFSSDRWRWQDRVFLGVQRPHDLTTSGTSTSSSAVSPPASLCVPVCVCVCVRVLSTATMHCVAPRFRAAQEDLHGLFIQTSNILTKHLPPYLTDLWGEGKK